MPATGGSSTSRPRAAFASRPTSRSSESASSQTSASSPAVASSSPTASSSISASKRARRTSTPPATPPTSTTRSTGAAGGSSTGRTPTTRAPKSARSSPVERGGYDTVSSFFTEVFGTTIKVFGDVSRFDALTTDGALDSGFLASYGDEGKLVGALTVGQSDELETLVRELIAERAPMDALARELVSGRSDDAPRAAVGARPERLDRLPVTRLDRVGRPRPRDRRRRRRRRHLESEHLRQSPLAGSAYDAQIAGSDGVPTSVFHALAMRDVSAACDVLRPVWERTGGRDGYVSIEVDPNLAADTDGSIAQATHFHETIARPNLLVKIPATDAGVPAIEEMTARGYSINVTLIFSLNRHRQVAEAYLRGLERLLAADGDPGPGSFGRQLLCVARGQRDRPSPRGSRPRRSPRPAGDRQRQARLPAIQGAVLRCPLGRARRARCDQAALPVGVDFDEGPQYRDTLYVDELIGPETITTMPQETIVAFQDHGRVERRLETELDAAQQVFRDLYAAGVDYDDVVATLEREGIEKFDAAFAELLEGIADKRRLRAPAS